MSYNAAAWLVDRHVDEGRGDRVALRCQGRSMTYAELAAETRRVQGLYASIGLTEGDRVAMVVRDDETFPATLLAGLRSGLVPVPLSTMLKGPALGEIIADSGAKALVISADFDELVGDIVAAAPALAEVVVAPAIVDGRGHVLAPIANQVRLWGLDGFDPKDPLTLGAEVAETTRESDGFWLYSSGTTGKPKGVMHRHGSLEVTYETYARQVLEVTAEDRFLSVAKLFFAYGLGNSLTFPLAAGATAILHPDPPTPSAILELIEAEQPTLFFSSPGFCAAILDTGPSAEAFAPVRATVTAGESLPANVQTRFAELTGGPVLDGIGSTELLHIFISNTLGAQVPGSSGWMVPGYEAELRNDDDQVVTDIDTPGYLHVRGGSAASGYWQRPDATAAAFRDRWVRTGDVYTRAKDGSWTFLGRNNDMIKAGGIWVSPAEVESVLIEDPTVLEAAVVGARDDQGLETVVAYVVAATGAAVDVHDLMAHCRDRMAAFKRPRVINTVDELPKTATGKIKRFELRSAP